MKNQNDLIIAISAVVLMLIGVGVSYATARKPIKPGPPETVVVTPAQMPEGSVQFANSLPAASDSNIPGGGVASGGMGGLAGGAGPSGGVRKKGPMGAAGT
ncbi:MAG: hypothetical protein M9921_04835 [Fimbriimonadaceae bacterium]|nr:hypothetical protein [Chthonomonadaceae bacterium]MCO5296163.1 hypothetical protein [Fimbriimonadaceae bacterium]